MKRLALAALVSAFAFAAEAQTTPTYSTFAFTAVDAVRHDSNGLYVTGVLDGALAAAEERLAFAWTGGHDQCLQLALLAMSKPGQYRFAVYGIRTGTPTYLYARDCKLERVAP